jgi:hypothetical protein
VQIPCLYPILDAGCFPEAFGLITAAEELVSAGVTLIQYRNKTGNARVMLEQARELRRLFPSHADVESHSNAAQNAALEWATQRVFRSGRLQGPRYSGALHVAQYFAHVCAHGAVFLAGWRQDLGSQLDLRAFAIRSLAANSA